MKKIKVGVIFGGRSGEHEVSIMSARSVIERLDREKYDVIPLAITRDGNWLPPSAATAALKAGSADISAAGLVALCPGNSEGGALVPMSEAARAELPKLDLVFPVLHGTYGEDGTIQGLLEMVGIPYVGAGVAGSAVGMDKALMKSVWAAHGLPQVRWVAVLRTRWERESERVLTELEQEPGYPCFVKPANLGSSVGISKVRTRDELRKAMDVAARFDRKIVIEQGIEKPREIELSVLGNDFPEVSLPGEVTHTRDFYDYKGKYFETDGQETHIPAKLAEEQIKELQALAIRAYQALDMNGLSRVDFLMDGAGRFYLNEVNTLPGFTPISMYTKLWEASGLPYPKLLDKLIELALERFSDRQRNACRPEEAEAVS